MAELMCVVATKDNGWDELHAYFSQLAQELESPGYKRPRKGKQMTQHQTILKLLKEGGTLTRLTAMHYGIMNITARVSELRKAGYDIKCRMKQDGLGREYGEFYLEGYEKEVA